MDRPAGRRGRAAAPGQDVPRRGLARERGGEGAAGDTGRGPGREARMRRRAASRGSPGPAHARRRGPGSAPGSPCHPTSTTPARGLHPTRLSPCRSAEGALADKSAPYRAADSPTRTRRAVPCLPEIGLVSAGYCGARRREGGCAARGGSALAKDARARAALNTRKDQVAIFGARVASGGQRNRGARREADEWPSV